MDKRDRLPLSRKYMYNQKDMTINNPERLIRFDWAMKSILRDKANFDILEGFLSALLKKDIRVERVLESESNQEHERQKFNRVDILVCDKKDNHFIIEVQAETESDYLERLLFGTCKTVVENLPLGASFKEIKKVISISIMYFNLGTGKDYLYHGRTEFKGVHTGDILEVRHIRKITDENNRAVRVLEPRPDMYPEYYLIEVERFEDVIREEVDEWVYFFKNEEIKDSFRSKNIQKTREKLKLLKMSQEERRAYEKYVINLVSERDAIETAKAEGEAIGEAIGEAKGVAIGEAKGKAEGISYAVLAVLRESGPVPAALEQKITEENNLDTLRKWLALAMRAESIEGFAEEMGQ